MTEHTFENDPEEPQEGAQEPPEGTEAPEDAQEPQDGSTEPESFPREVVEKLRRENATYREKAKATDVLAERLHEQLVKATGRLADPTDLAYDAEHLDNEDALEAAITKLLERKPHLASRKPSGDVGQGASASGDTVDLAGMLRARAG